jgi:hypothetical protein
MFCNVILTAQELPSGQIEVIKDFEVRLTEAKKIRIVPQPVTFDTSLRRFEYQFLASSPQIEYVQPEIKALAIQPEEKPTYYPLTMKAGYGSPNSLLGALQWDQPLGDIFQYGLSLDYLSANNKKIPLQKFSDSHGRLYGTYQWRDDVQVSGHIDARYQTVHFYGGDEPPSEADQLQRKFTRYNVGVQWKKYPSKSSSFQYQAFLAYQPHSDDLGSRETTWKAGGGMSTALGESAFPIGMSVEADLSKLKHTGEYPLNLLLLSPYAGYHIGDLKLRIGGTAAIKKGDPELLPDILASFSLWDDYLILKAGWLGNARKNNYQNLSTINHYLQTRLDSINIEISRSLFAAATAASGTLTLEVKGEYTRFHQRAFLLQDENATEQFIPVFDDGYFIGFTGLIQYEVLRDVDIRGSVFQRFYTLDHENKPWHTPSFGLDAMLTYTGGSDDYHVSILFHGENGLPYRTVGGTESRLDALVDLNLHGDYYITESFGAFVQLNNILGNKRERWHTYPGYGFNAKAGILFRLAE